MKEITDYDEHPENRILNNSVKFLLANPEKFRKPSRKDTFFNRAV